MIVLSRARFGLPDTKKRQPLQGMVGAVAIVEPDVSSGLLSKSRTRAKIAAVCYRTVI
jgi:hypothetical protein